MGKRGPKRTPTATLKLRGSWRASDRPNEPRVKPAIPSMPRWLTEDAKKEWKRVAGPLRDAGILTVLDRAILTCYCLAVGDLMECRRVIEREGSILTSDKGGKYVHPAVSVMQNASSRILKTGAEMGLTPASRPGIYATAPPPRDALDAFMQRKDGGKPGKDRGRKPS